MTIKDCLPETEILAQLAEESTELAQAALKLRRVLDGTNPTPATEVEGWEHLMEEYADVLNCIDALHLDLGDMEIVSIYRQEKMTRWLARLEGRDE